MNNLIELQTGEDFDREFGFDVPLDDEYLGDGIPSLGMTWGELKYREFPKSEKVIFGLGRGQVGMMIASTNVGKTTFALNIILSAIARRPFPPFLDGQQNVQRVMFIDGESTKAELQSDIKTMMRVWTKSEHKLVEDNLMLVCDEYIKDEPLNLSNPFHFKAVIDCAVEFQPDLIIVDTASALFNLQNENDNAEIKRRVMTPLKILAKESNSAVWLQHHSGKQSEDPKSTNAAYSGRGGSNFGSLARTVMRLIAPDKIDKTRVVFSVAKSKGYRQDDVVLRLDQDARWFSVATEIPPPQLISSYDEVKDYVTREMSTKEIVDAFLPKYSKRTIEDNLKSAVENRHLKKVRQGVYAPIDSAVSAPTIGDCGNCGNGDGLDECLPSETEFDRIKQIAERYDF